MKFLRIPLIVKHPRWLLLFNLFSCIYLRCNVCFSLQAFNYGGRTGHLPCPFLKFEKSILILEKKAPIVSIFKVVLKVSRKKTFKIFPLGAFIVFLMKCLLKCHNSTKSPMPFEISIAKNYSKIWNTLWIWNLDQMLFISNMII